MKLIEAIKVKIQEKDAVEIVIGVKNIEEDPAKDMYYDILNVEGVYRQLDLEAKTYGVEVGGLRCHISADIDVELLWRSPVKHIDYEMNKLGYSSIDEFMTWAKEHIE